VRIFLAEIAFFHRELDQSFSPVECVSGADMVAESDFAGAHTLYLMVEPMYRPVVESGFVVEENECVVASVCDEHHTHAKVSGQFSQLDDSFLLLFGPQT
jgi:hypothetical protein